MKHKDKKSRDHACIEGVGRKRREGLGNLDFSVQLEMEAEINKGKEANLGSSGTNL